MTAQPEQTPKEKLAAVMAELGLSFSFEFVPLSKVSAERRASWSHDGKPALFLTWNATLTRTHQPEGVAMPLHLPVLKTDYSAGSGHCPASKHKGLGVANSVDRVAAIKAECESGRYATPDQHRGKPILPDPVDVLWSLVQDTDVLEAGGFESWAGDYGYDTDSRKAEAIYRACLEIALKLRAAIGDEGLRQLREAGQDY